MIISEEDYIQHHGVKGQKWGVRHDPAKTGFGRKPPPPLKKKKSQTKVTQKVIDDYNSMNGRKFFAKYATTKHTYAKRVREHGDPYQHRINEIKKERGISGAKKKGKKKPLLTPKQKEIAEVITITGATTAVALLARYGAKKYGLIKPKSYTPTINYDKIADQAIDSLKRVSKTTKPLTRKEHFEFHGTQDPIRTRQGIMKTRAILERELQRPHKVSTLSPRQALLREQARRR